MKGETGTKLVVPRTDGRWSQGDRKGDFSLPRQRDTFYFIANIGSKGGGDVSRFSDQKQ